jgi:lysophospholipase L1-like esterase
MTLSWQHHVLRAHRIAWRTLTLGIVTLAACTARTAPRTTVPPRRSAADSAMLNDFANLARYRAANATLPAPATGEQRVVFMGNSITEGWVRHFPSHFPGKPYVGRGISGQTTPQMVLRMHADVVALRPAVVVILAGTNDIAGNTGPSTLEMIEDNIRAMTEIAQANRIRVVLCSVLPAFDYPWKPELQPAPKIVALNAWIRSYAASVGAAFVDYHSAMRDSRDGLRAELGGDGVHPNDAGYRIMAPLVEAGITAALQHGVPR